MKKEYLEYAREGLIDMYGPETPVQCRLRMETEMHRMPTKYFEDDIILSAVLCRAAKEDGCRVRVGYNSGSSFVSWMAGSTSVNPLPPHYHCPVCKKTVFFEGGDAWDLPPMPCCGNPLFREGHNIPFESFLTVLRIPNDELLVTVTPSFLDKAIEVIQSHFAEDYQMIPLVTEFCHENEYVLIPLEDDLPDLEDGTWFTDRGEVYDLGYRVVQLICSDTLEQLKELRAKVGREPSANDLLTEPVLTEVKTALENEILELEDPEDSFFASKPLLTDEALKFSQLIRMEGYLHADYTAENSALMDETARYSAVFTCREDVWDLVTSAIKPEYGVSMDFAAQVMECTRKGMYTRGRMDQATETLLRDLGISEHWISQMKHTAYLPPRARVIDLLIDRMELAWYELKEKELEERV